MKVCFSLPAFEDRVIKTRTTALLHEKPGNAHAQHSHDGTGINIIKKMLRQVNSRVAHAQSHKEKKEFVQPVIGNEREAKKSGECSGGVAGWKTVVEPVLHALHQF